MAITNISKPTTTLSNTTKVDIGETWDSSILDWDTEVRSWDDLASIISNTAKVSSSLTNSAKT